MLKNVLIDKGLSRRETEVVEQLVLGKTNKEIADTLFVTEKTIKFHLTNIYKKMCIRSRSQLIVWSLPYLDFVESNPSNNTSTETTQLITGSQKIA